MPSHGCSHTERSDDRAGLEVADVFRAHGEDYRKTHALSAEQQRVWANIVTCRTAQRGGHLYECDHCDYKTPAYNSCGDRNCPKCQALSQAKWIEQRIKRLLPTHYFHLVFTLPAELRSIALCNRKLVFNMLFAAASQTLLTIGRDDKYLGGQLGITAVLHTWTRTLDFHPHVHCIVTGGGLEEHGARWIGAKPDFLFPVKVLSRLFRGKFLDALAQAYANGSFVFAGGCAELDDPERFQRLKDTLYNKEWVVYAKRSFGGPENVFKYLGRYTHRVAISNQRLIAMNDHGVTFFTKDGNTATLKPTEFIRRFLMHVLPKRYVKIRHYGLKAAGNVNTKLVRARQLIETSLDNSNDQKIDAVDDDSSGASWIDHVLALTGSDHSICPRCGVGRMIRTIRLIPDTAAYSSPLERDTS